VEKSKPWKIIVSWSACYESGDANYASWDANDESRGEIFKAWKANYASWKAIYDSWFVFHGLVFEQKMAFFASNLLVLMKNGGKPLFRGSKAGQKPRPRPPLTTEAGHPPPSAPPRGSPADPPPTPRTAHHPQHRRPGCGPALAFLCHDQTRLLLSSVANEVGAVS